MSRLINNSNNQVIISTNEISTSAIVDDAHTVLNEIREIIINEGKNESEMILNILKNEYIQSKELSSIATTIIKMANYK